MIIFGWELPKDFFQVFVENRVSELKNVHGHQEDVEEIESQRVNLLLIYSDTQHVTQSQVLSENP